MNKDSNTPLHLAALGFTGIVEMLLGKGAPVEARDKNNNTPLHLAIRNGHTGIVGPLLDRGAPVEAVEVVQLMPTHHTLMHSSHVSKFTGHLM